MAYEVEYYCDFYNLGNIPYRVDILSDGFSGSPSAIENPAAQPIVQRHNGIGKNDYDNTIIQGQELQFNFYVARADIAEFDALFESEYKDYKVRLYSNYGESVQELEFEGYLKPENLSREFTQNPPQVLISGALFYFGNIEICH